MTAAADRPVSSRPGSRRVAWWVLGGLWAVVIGCRTQPDVPPSEQVVLDLVQQFDRAEVQVPTRLMNLGEDPEVGRLLVEGWSRDTRPLITPMAEEPGLGICSLGDAASLEFYTASTDADLPVTFRAAEVGRANSSRVVTLSVNGHSWTEIRVEREFRAFRRTIPSRLLVRGANRLGIRHPPSSAAPWIEAKDVRVVWDFIKFDQPGPARGTAFARTDRTTVFIPTGARVDFFAELEPGTWLLAEDARIRNSTLSRMRVTWTPEGQDSKLLSEDFAAVPEVSVPIVETSTTQRGRLSLDVFGPTDDPESAGAVIRAPRVVARLTESGRPGRADSSRPAAAEAATNPQLRPVIIYLVDTLRADRLSSYGYSRPTTPNLDRFAESAVLFSHAQAQSPWTRASVASVLTGLWPQSHGAVDHEDMLSDDVSTLAELLQAVGYETAAVTANGNSSRTFGFSQGFESFKYLERPRAGELLARDRDVVEAAIAWLDLRQSPSSPFFLYVHTIDPHLPYEPMPEFRRAFAPEVRDPQRGTLDEITSLSEARESASDQVVRETSDLYDAEVAGSDAVFGVFLDALRQRGLFDDSLIVFLSDHGEELGDHGGWNHGHTLHSELLDIPLMIRLPGGLQGVVVDPVVQQVDVLPTVLESLGLPLPEGLAGRSLVPLLTRADLAGDWSEQAYAHMHLRGRDGRSLIDGRWKSIEVNGAGGTFPNLYDRISDPGERDNLAPERPDLARYLASVRRALEAQTIRGAPVAKADAEEMEQLRQELEALGYIESRP